MDPSLKFLLNKFNRRFDDHDAKWEQRFTDLNCDRSAHDVIVDCRFAELAQPSAVIDQRLADLELVWVNQKVDVTRRLSDLKVVRVQQISDERDEWVAELKVAAADINAWIPELEGVVDDLKLEVQKIANIGTTWCSTHCLKGLHRR